MLDESFQFTEGQKLALEGVRNWYKHVWAGKDEPNWQQVYRLFGYAGTGKTTITQELVKDIKGLICYATFTGKAALVMQRHGMPATTLHSLIYRFQAPDQLLQNKLLEELHKEEDQQLREDLMKRITAAGKPGYRLDLHSPLRNASLLVVDECSMVYNELGVDVESFGVPILVIGDPGQLPPVKGTGIWTQAKPDVMLDEVMRQALDNPIIRLATDVRLGKGIKLGTYGETKVISMQKLGKDDVLEADQIITGMHKHRRAMNQRYRMMKGYHGIFPNKFERLLCLRNNARDGLINGLQGIMSKWPKDLGEYMEIQFRPEDSTEARPVKIHKAHFMAYNNPKILKDMNFWDLQKAEEFDFGYVLTGHKSQGSQWDNVMVYDDGFGFSNRTLRRQWQYTTMTRAIEQLTFIKAD